MSDSTYGALLQVQCTGVVPTVAIDKVDGCQVSSLSCFSPCHCLQQVHLPAARALQGESPALQLETNPSVTEELS